MESEEERRRFQRLLVTLPVEYIASHPESGEIHQGQGILKDFSLGGIFFHSLEPVLLQPGQTLTLTISTPLPPLSRHDASFIRAQAEVVRLEEPSQDSYYHGVAVSFLDFPSFFSLSNQVNNHL